MRLVLLLVVSALCRPHLWQADTHTTLSTHMHHKTVTFQRLHAAPGASAASGRMLPQALAVVSMQVVPAFGWLLAGTTNIWGLHVTSHTTCR